MQENEPSIHIRLVTADDALSIASVLYEAFVEYESSYTHAAFAATTPTSEQIMNPMSEGPGLDLGSAKSESSNESQRKEVMPLSEGVLKGLTSCFVPSE